MGSLNLPITLDSGATVSYIRLEFVQKSKMRIRENNQLALLADEKTRMASMGEIDEEVNLGFVVIRLRALVMEHLQAMCFGGTTFHNDNKILANVTTGEIKIHNQFVVGQSNSVRHLQAFQPSRLSLEDPQ